MVSRRRTLPRNKVFIVPPLFGVDPLFEKYGWEIVDDIDQADLVQWTGGADINPRIYNQAKHHTTYFTPARDAHEILSFQIALAKKKPMAGICRGAQLLNALLGGSMWQHVDGHSRGNHQMVDTTSGEVRWTTSVHHQMMIPGPGAKIVATAHESTQKEKMGIPGSTQVIYNRGNFNQEPDIEALWWPEHNAFGIQGHPEYMACKLDEYYFEKLDTLLGLKTAGISS